MKFEVDVRRLRARAETGRSWRRVFERPGKGTSRPEAESVVLSPADGYPTIGMRYATQGRTHAHLIVAGTVGVPQRFYRRFAEFAAASGYSTMTLDYRGVGLSAPTTLKGFRMDYFDWSRLDLAAAVAAMSSPHVPLYMLGHSFGGHAFGVLPNHERVVAFYTFGTGAGWHGWMPLLERIKVLAMWHVLGPLLTSWSGYLSWSLLGIGEDLPLDFYHRWKQWCRNPNYFFGDPSVRHLLRSFDQVRAPMMAANSIDDRWAPPRSRDAFMAGYRNAARHTLDIDPSHVGLRAIGHMGYFKPDAMPLWEAALDWLATRRNPEALHPPFSTIRPGEGRNPDAHRASMVADGSRAYQAHAGAS
jgi:predicted alpha/beta hydrolase